MRNYLLLIAAMISWGLSNPLADLAVSELSAPAQTLLEISSGDRKSTRLNSSHIPLSRMPSSA